MEYVIELLVYLLHNNILFYDITFLKVIVIEINDPLLGHVATRIGHLVHTPHHQQCHASKISKQKLPYVLQKPYELVYISKPVVLWDKLLQVVIMRSVDCLTAGPQLLRQPVLHRVWSSALSLNFQYPYFPYGLPGAACPFFLVFPSLQSILLSFLEYLVRRKFLRKM